MGLVLWILSLSQKGMHCWTCDTCDKIIKTQQEIRIKGASSHFVVLTKGFPKEQFCEFVACRYLQANSECAELHLFLYNYSYVYLFLGQL